MTSNVFTSSKDYSSQNYCSWLWLLLCLFSSRKHFSYFAVHANCLDEPKLDVPEYRLLWQSRKTALEEIFLFSFFLSFLQFLKHWGVLQKNNGFCDFSFCARNYDCSALLVNKHWVWVRWGETSVDLFFQNVMIIMNNHDHDEDGHNDSELSMMRWGEGKEVLLTFSSLRCCRQSIYTLDEKTHKLFEHFLALDFKICGN